VVVQVRVEDWACGGLWGARRGLLDLRLLDLRLHALAYGERGRMCSYRDMLDLRLLKLLWLLQTL